jgi:hypothetical protein
MIERSREHFDLYPQRLIGDTAYGSAEMLNWPVNDQGRAAHSGVRQIPAQRGTFSRDETGRECLPTGN